MRTSKNPSYDSPPFSPYELCTLFTSILLLVPLVFVFSLFAFDHHNISRVSSFYGTSLWSVRPISNEMHINSSQYVHPTSNETRFNLSQFVHPTSNETRFNSSQSVHPTSNETRSNSSQSVNILRFRRIEDDLARARFAIREAARNTSPISCHQDPDYVPRGPIYRNPNAFHRSYLEMEKVFKIYVYKEGEPPMFHNGACKSLYSSEGKFIHDMEKEGNPYKTDDPHKAHVFFLPFSVVMMVEYLHEPGSHHIHPIGRTVKDYIDVVRNKHGFWNRSHGADHFMLSCHDWGPWATRYEAELYNNSMRALCNANTSEGFNPSKDVSFPEINLLSGDVPASSLGGLPPSRRSVLAFFAGRLHGHIRSILLHHWKKKYAEHGGGGLNDAVLVYDQLPPGVSYSSMLKKSRFCLCPSGFEVASPRVVEAIYADCVPVLISDGYSLPFSDVLNWDSFSIRIKVEDIPKIDNVLKAISMRKYLKMQGRVRQVKRHFFVNRIPKRFDVFHMIVHSIWLRRLNIHIEEPQSSVDLVSNVVT